MFDYIAFGIISEFDSIVLTLYQGRTEIQLLGLDIVFSRFKKKKELPLTKKSRETKQFIGSQIT